MATTGFVSDERFLQHDTGHAALVLAPNEVSEPDQHSESPVRIRRTVNLLNSSGLTAQLQQLPCTSATLDEVTLDHRPEYIRAVADLPARGVATWRRAHPWAPRRMMLCCWLWAAG
jgi:acetoin utilization deacetylase AcuC-like enzyme